MVATLNSISPLVELRVLSAAPPILYSLKQHFHGGPNGPSKDRRKDPNKRSNYGSKANAYQNVHCSSLDLTEDKDIDRKGPAPENKTSYVVWSFPSRHWSLRDLL